MIVLDTNVVSELMKAETDGRVRDWLLGLGETPLTTTAITVAEIEFGLGRLPDGRRRDALQSRFESLAAALSILPLDDAAARQAGRFRARREALGLPGAASDMMIAGIAALVGATLATRNVKDFEALPLPIVDPWRAA